MPAVPTPGTGAASSFGEILGGELGELIGGLLSGLLGRLPGVVMTWRVSGLVGGLVFLELACGVVGNLIASKLFISGWE